LQMIDKENCKWLIRTSMTYKGKTSNMQRWQELEQATEELLKLHRLKYHRVTNYRCFKCGQVQNTKAKHWPDFYVYSPIRLAIECKTGKGELSKGQLEVKADLEAMGCEYIVVRDNLDKLIKRLK